jgi:TrmH family RNA methyltransferase
VTGVILSPNTVDIYNPKTIRSTMGSVYRVPFFYAKDFTQQLADLKQAGVRLYAAHLDGNCEYTHPDFLAPVSRSQVSSWHKTPHSP